MRLGVLVGWLCAAPGLVLTASLAILAVGMWLVPGCMVEDGGAFTFNGQRVECVWPPLRMVLAPIAVVAGLTIYMFILTVIPILYSWGWVVWRAVRAMAAPRRSA
jgi:hypothetical protein